ncbi:helix-turn-helix transcriptional regulator [Rhodohalobacter sulfatireducens]|uniref:Helix-turn-helix transcriptional regulator n=1 Tax=Rhodohalobacter sulfatireducens TaxID=2911366 RepID=A0ABS9KAN2_9BACT|nr:helix-turn-helix transcriptional regulator [Rhodohalobacter sulfatireducens]MCG2587914.1 helix-turn-helix transcriptional regulator [Rhodohalobacter sulfatireducens]
MDYKEYWPPKEISHLVECFWTNTLHPDDFQQEYDFIIPDGGADAIFMLNGHYLREDEENSTKYLVDQCSFVTPFQRAVKVYQEPYTTCLAVRFRPEAIQALTGVTLGELDRPAYPLYEIMPELADLVMSQISKKSSEAEIIRRLTGWLSQKQIEPSANAIVTRFIDQTIQSKGKVGIKNFCGELQVHKSTLEKNFKHYTGYTPKEYSKVIRFNFLLNRILFSPMNLTEITYEMGFFDQSHMIRDFRKITGMNPTDFIEKKFTVPKLAAMAISNKRLYL